MTSTATRIAPRIVRSSESPRMEREGDQESTWGGSNHKSNHPDISDLLRFALGYNTFSALDYMHSVEDTAEAMNWFPSQPDVFTSRTTSQPTGHSIPRRLSLSTKLVPTTKPQAGSNNTSSAQASAAYGRKILKPKPPSMGLRGARSHTHTDSSGRYVQNSGTDGPDSIKKHRHSAKSIPEHSIPKRTVCWR